MGFNSGFKGLRETNGTVRQKKLAISHSNRFVSRSHRNHTNSIEIPTRCSFVIEFIIPKLIEGSTFQFHFPLSVGNGRSPHGYINQRLQTQFRAPDDERCAARNMLSPQ